jgi:hypothetical protein
VDATKNPATSKETRERFIDEWERLEDELLKTSLKCGLL